MKETHEEHNQLPSNEHKIRPVVIAVTAAIGISALLAGCGGGGGGGGHGGGSTNGLLTSGGDAGKTSGAGGSAGHVWLYAGDAATVIDILTSTKNAPDVSGIPDPDLGAAPLNIDADTTIPVEDPANAPLNEYFQVAGDCHIYQSDGDGGTVPGVDAGDIVVTGVEVAGKKKLMLQDNLGATGCIRVDNDIVNDGTIMPETEGGSLALYSDNFFGSGPVTTSGGSSNPDAGDIAIYANSAIYNEGDMSATGADSSTANGGAGGNIELYAAGNLWTRGKLSTLGGKSTFAGGTGGAGGDVYLYTDVTTVGESLISWGKIDSSGGDGNGGGGAGGDVGVGLYGPAAAEGVSSNVYVLAGVDTTGGATTGPDGNAGAGGDITMAIQAPGGSLEILGLKKIEAMGGNGADGGGDGGWVALYSDGNDANYTNELPIDTTGGDATVGGVGGTGGDIDLYNDGGASTIVNKGDLTASGGSGVDGGGFGGYVRLYVWEGGTADAGSVTNSGKLTTKGGDHTGNSSEAAAGDGGYVEVEIENANGTVSNSGAIDTSGGKSTKGSGGSGGSVEVELEGVTDAGSPDNSVSNTASITTNGGVGGVDGGSGGSVDFYSPGVVTTNSGAISTQGGAGSTGNGGDGGSVSMYGEPVTNKGNVNASGGNGDVNGGNGGNINLYSTGADPTDNTGKLTSAGGTGTTPGTPGTITIDGVTP
jgi:hypothetical protein